MKITLKALIAAGLATVAAAAGVVYFGVINVGADDPHSAPVYALLSIARDRSIEVRSRDIQVPDLSQKPSSVKVLATTTRCVSVAIWLRALQAPN
ncbi:hypothetical protein V5O39_23910 [Pseudomonas parakoreensis]